MSSSSLLLPIVLLATVFTIQLALPVSAEGVPPPLIATGSNNNNNNNVGDDENNNNNNNNHPPPSHRNEQLATVPCSSFTSCTECVYDATRGILSKYQRCAWCATTSTCHDLKGVTSSGKEGEEGNRNNNKNNNNIKEGRSFSSSSSSSLAQCPDIRSTFGSYNRRCPAMRCAAAYTTNNVYFCRGTNISALVFGIILLIITVFFYFWMRAIHQLPWRYPNIHELVRRVGTQTPLLRLWKGGVKLEGEEATLRCVSDGGGSKCPICKVTQPSTLGPAEVCYWCDVARLAYIPFYLGLSGSTLTIIFLFAVSLKPWFGDWYYAWLLTVPYLSYTLFIWFLYVTRVSVIGDSSQVLGMFFQLAVILRGRKLSSVFKIEDMSQSSNNNVNNIIGNNMNNSSNQQQSNDNNNDNTHNDNGEEEMTLSKGMPNKDVNHSINSNNDINDNDAPNNNNNNNNTDPAAATTTTTNNNNVATSSTNTSTTNNTSATLTTRTAAELEDERNRRRADTLQLLGMEHFNADISQAIRAEIMGHRDEYIVWFDRPDHNKVAADDRWLITVFVCLTCFALWLCVCSTVDAKKYAITRLMDAGNMMFIGGCLFVLGITGLFTAVNGCKRVYLLTNYRIITVAHGLFGVHLSATPLQKLQYAAVFGYDEWFTGPILSFSWEAPDADRKMPPIRTNRLPAITNMDEFLTKFSEVAPPLTKAAALRENLKHLRTVWRLHVFVNIMLINVMPIALVYSQITPGLLSITGMIIMGAFFGCLIQRGLRMQQVTYATIHLAKKWSEWTDDPAQKFFRKLIDAGKKTATLPGMGHKKGSVDHKLSAGNNNNNNTINNSNTNIKDCGGSASGHYRQ